MKISDLRNGMLLEYRNGIVRFYKDNKTYGWASLKDVYTASYDFMKEYTEDLIKKNRGFSDLDIVKVYSDMTKDKLLWERKNVVDWSKVKINTPVNINKSGVTPIIRHFAGVSAGGNPLVWVDGKTSYTTTASHMPLEIELLEGDK